jgi:hypothetical protein
MIRKTIIAGALLGLAAHLHAQSPPPPHPGGHDMLGVWEGKFTSNHDAEGTLRITIAHDSAVRVTMEFGSSLQVPPSAFTSITHEGVSVKWTQEILDTACEGSGTIEEHKFKGEIHCGPAVIAFDVRKRE